MNKEQRSPQVATWMPLSFKEFVLTLPDDVSPEDAQARYEVQALQSSGRRHPDHSPNSVLGRLAALERERASVEQVEKLIARVRQLEDEAKARDRIVAELSKQLRKVRDEIGS